MSESLLNYQESSKKIKDLERSFAFSTTIVGVLVAFIAAVGFYYHHRVSETQTYIRKINKIIVKQSNTITRISVLGGFLDESAPHEDLIRVRGKLSNLIKALNESEHELSKLILKAENASVKDLKDFLKKNQVETKLDAFLARANVIINPLSSNKEIKESIHFLAGDNKKGSLTYSDEFLKLLDQDYIQGMRSLERIGLFVILSSLVVLFVVWFLLFRPLSKTVLEQNRQILDSSLQIESVSRSRTEFLANISHEIRTPMTGILGYTEHLEEELTSPKHKKVLKIINQNASHLLNLLDDILDMSKVKAAKFDLSYEKISLRTFLKTTFNLMKIKAEEKDLEFVVDLPDNLPHFVKVDATRLRQIIFNIVGNAIKFTQEGIIEVKVGVHKKHLYVEISDTGTGIDPQKEQKIFRPFEQARNEASQDIGGTGLGLSLSKGLAQKMGGDVQLISNQPGEGCTFRISVKLKTVESEIEAPPELDVSEVPGSLEGARVLLVDDSKENLALFTLQLSDSKCDLTTVTSGIEALNVVEEQPIDIILLDLQMPVMDGYATLEELKEQGFQGPILALTAHASEEERRKTQKAGFSAHITKPVKKADLLASIYKYLS